MARNFIAIEGNIGSGKTTLSKLLSEDVGAKLLLEQFADNPFLPKFYEDPKKYAFPLEMSFLAERYQQLSDSTSQPDLFAPLIISDYYVFKSVIFSEITLEKDEFDLYRKLFFMMYRTLNKPDLFVYLYQSTDRLLDNIKHRGRPYEQNIKPEYLENIQKGYLDFIKKEPNIKFLVIDISNADFVNNKEHYNRIKHLVLESEYSDNYNFVSI